MDGFIDIHSHVIPCVDDGSQSIEQSVKMLEIAASEGISTIIATPHQKADRRCVTPEGIVKRIVILQKKADELKIPVKLFPGNEIFYQMCIRDRLQTAGI